MIRRFSASFAVVLVVLLLVCLEPAGKQRGLEGGAVAKGEAGRVGLEHHPDLRECGHGVAALALKDRRVRRLRRAASWRLLRFLAA